MPRSLAECLKILNLPASIFGKQERERLIQAVLDKQYLGLPKHQTELEVVRNTIDETETEIKQLERLIKIKAQERLPELAKGGRKKKQKEIEKARKPEIGTVDKLNVTELAKEFEKHIDTDSPKLNKVKVQALVANMLGMKRSEMIKHPKFSNKPIEEAFELALVKKARNIISRGIPIDETYKELKKLYEWQPNLATRTSGSIAQQAYSTPIHLAYLMQIATGVDNKTTVYEPTAGNGSLLTMANPKNVIANEIDEIRLGNLDEQGFTTTELDARHAVKEGDPNKISAKSFDVVIMNPPFGKEKTTDEYDGFQLRQLDHKIVANSLEAMKDDGTAAILIGDRNISRGRYSDDDRIFFNWLYHHYNVKENIGVPGKEYRKQGTSYPVRLIIVDGRKDMPSGYGPVNAKDKRFEKVESVDDILPIAKELNDEIEAERMATERPTVERPAAPVAARPSGIREGAGGATEEATRPVKPEPYAEGEGGRPAKGPGEKGELGPGSVPTGQLPAGVQGAGAVVERPGTTGGIPTGELLKPTETATGPRGGLPEREAKPERLPERGRVEGERPGLEVKPGRGEEGRPGIRPMGVPGGGRSTITRKSKIPEKLEKTEYQITYVPRSKGPTIDEVLMPKRMKQAIDKALADIEKETNQSIDEYVKEKLNYKSDDELWKAFSAEQVDSIALAIYNIEKGKSLIIADQTGVGKGRMAAAMYRYAKLNDLVPIFFTEKANLFSDFYRDITDINEKFNPLILASKAEARIVDKEGNTVFKPPLGTKKKQIIDQIMADGFDSTKFDGIVTTYSQINKPGNPQQQLLTRLIPGNLLILDESHNATGNNSNTGKFLRNLVTSAKVTYLSATYAKRSDSLGLYRTTDLGMVMLGDEELESVLSRGGVAMQEIISEDLVEAKQLIRREQSFKGVEIRAVTLTEGREKQIEQSDTATSLLRQILKFDKELARTFKKLVAEAQEQGRGSVFGVPIGGISIAGEGGRQHASVNKSNFAAVVHNFISQFLLAQKAQAAVDVAIKHLSAKNKRKPVIALSNTLETITRHLMLNDVISLGENILDIDFREALIRQLQGTLYVSVKEPGSRKATRYTIKLENLPADLRKKYLNLLEKIKKIKLDLPISPIDYIKVRLKEAGYKVDEITGREFVADINAEGYPLIRRKTSEINDKNSKISAFNNGDIDVLIINASGSAGLSLHASPTFKDKTPRVYIGVQPELNIDTEVQKMGRIHRKAQVALPLYELLQLDLPAEIRPAAIHLKKMKSLSANISANADSPLARKEFMDIMNPYGDKAVATWLDKNKKYASILRSESDKNDSDLAIRVTGKVALLPVSEQERFFREVEQIYTDIVNEAIEKGTYNLKVSEYNFKAKTIERNVLVMGSDESSPFGRSAYMEKVEVVQERRPLSKKQIEDRLRSELEPFGYPENGLEEARNAYYKAIANKIRLNFEEFLDELPEETPASKRRQLEAKARATIELLESWSPKLGDTYLIQLSEDVSFLGVLGRIDYKPHLAKNPASKSTIKFVFYVNQPLRYYYMTLAGYSEDRFRIRKRIQTGVPDNWNESLVTKIKTLRNIVTGNVITGFNAVDGAGQLIRFSRDDGTWSRGILLPGEATAKTVVQNTLRVTPDVATDIMMNHNIVPPVTGLDFGVGKIKWQQGADLYHVAFPRSKKLGGKYFLDELLCSLTTRGEFESIGNEMRADVRAEDLRAFVNRLAELGAYPDLSMIFYNDNKGLIDEIKEKAEAHEDYAIEESASMYAANIARQAIDSRKTARNIVPAAAKLIAWKPGTVNFDIGGGPYERFTNYLKTKGIDNLVYDPYNRSREHNQTVIRKLKDNKADTATCFNVLNVIKEQDVRASTIKLAAESIKANGKAYFAVYEGNKSGKGTQTRDGWQENRKIETYIPEIEAYFNNVERKGKLIIAKEPRQEAIDSSTVSREAFGSIEEADSIIDEIAKEVEEFERLIDGLPKLRTFEESVREWKSNVARDLSKQGYVDLRGYQLDGRNPGKTIASLMQLFRTPRMEILHVVYTDSEGNIVGHTALTSGQLDRVALSKTIYKEFYNVQRRLARLHADKVHFIHNHPSGNPSPSSGDINTAKAWKRRLGNRMGSFIVINGGKYAEVIIDPHTYLHTIEIKNYPKLRGVGEWTSQIRPMFNSSKELAAFVAELNLPEDKIAILYVDASLQLNGWSTHNEKFLDRSPEKILFSLRQMMKAHDATRVVIAGVDKNKMKNLLETGLGSSFIIEAIDKELGSLHEEMPECFRYTRPYEKEENKVAWRLFEEQEKYGVGRNELASWAQNYIEAALARGESEKATGEDKAKANSIKTDLESFDDEMGDSIRSSLEALGKGFLGKTASKWKESKPDTTFWDRVLASPEFYFEKVPAARRVLEARLRKPENFRAYFNDITNYGEFIEEIKQLKKTSKNEYKRLKQLIKKADQNHIAYKEEDLIKMGFSYDAIRAWQAYRQIMNRGFDYLQQKLNELIEKYGADNLPALVTVVDGERIRVDIKTALATMGDLRPFYAPRKRRPGKWSIIAKKPGAHPILEFRDSKKLADILAAKYEAKGYTVTKKKTEKMPEDVFEMMGRVLSVQGILNRAFAEVSKKKGKWTLDHFGLNAEWEGNHFVITGPTSKRMNAIFKELGGKLINNTRWTFFDANPDIEERLEKALTNELTGLITFNEDIAFAYAILQSTAEIIKGRGVRSRMIRRGKAKGLKVWEGYEEDPLMAAAQYAVDISAGLAKKQSLFHGLHVK